MLLAANVASTQTYPFKVLAVMLMESRVELHSKTELQSPLEKPDVDGDRK